MNFFKWIFSSQKDPLPLTDSPLVSDCKTFMATGQVSERLLEKMAFFKEQNSQLSDYECIEYLLDAEERRRENGTR